MASPGMTLVTATEAGAITPDAGLLRQREKARATHFGAGMPGLGT